MAILLSAVAVKCKASLLYNNKCFTYVVLIPVNFATSLECFEFFNYHEHLDHDACIRLNVGVLFSVRRFMLYFVIIS